MERLRDLREHEFFEKFKVRPRSLASFARVFRPLISVTDVDNQETGSWGVDRDPAVISSGRVPVPSFFLGGDGRPSVISHVPCPAGDIVMASPSFSGQPGGLRRSEAGTKA